MILRKGLRACQCYLELLAWGSVSWKLWAQWVENGTERFCQKCIRDTFIDDPFAEWDDMIDAAMDRVAKHSIVHDRRSLARSKKSSLARCQPVCPR